MVAEGDSSREPLSAGGRSQHLVRGDVEDGPRRLHREDEVEVGRHHDEAWQEGKAETETTKAAAQRRRHPVRQPGVGGGGDTHTHKRFGSGPTRF